MLNSKFLKKRMDLLDGDAPYSLGKTNLGLALPDRSRALAQVP